MLSIEQVRDLIDTTNKFGSGPFEVPYTLNVGHIHNTVERQALHIVFAWSERYQCVICKTKPFDPTTELLSSSELFSMFDEETRTGFLTYLIDEFEIRIFEMQQVDQRVDPTGFGGSVLCLEAQCATRH